MVFYTLGFILFVLGTVVVHVRSEQMAGYRMTTFHTYDAG